MKECNLYFIISRIKNDTFTNKDISQLIDYCIKTAISFLRNNYKTRINSNLFSEESISDLAIDSIIPLVVKNNEGILGIKKSILTWDEEIKNEIDAQFFISKLIWKRADQTITKLLKEKDPFFEKIIKTLNFCISKNNIKKIRYFGTVYVVEENVKELPGNLIKFEDFSKIPVEFFGFKQIVLFEKLLEHIKTKTEYFPAIPLNLLVKRVKEFYLSSRQISISEYSYINNAFVYEDILKNELSSLQNRINTFYIPNSKLTKKDAELIMASFRDISKDMLNGGISGSLFDYLKNREESLTSEQFYSDYHSIMNCLFKNFKNRILEGIK